MDNHGEEPRSIPSLNDEPFGLDDSEDIVEEREIQLVRSRGVTRKTRVSTVIHHSVKRGSGYFWLMIPIDEELLDEVSHIVFLEKKTGNPILMKIEHD